MRLPSSGQVSWWASNCTRASGPWMAACALSSGQVTKWSPPSDSRKAPDFRIFAASRSIVPGVFW